MMFQKWFWIMLVLCGFFWYGVFKFIQYLF